MIRKPFTQWKRRLYLKGKGEPIQLDFANPCIAYQICCLQLNVTLCKMMYIVSQKNKQSCP